MISVLQSSLLVLAMVLLGDWTGPKVKLGTPVIDALLAGDSVATRLKAMLLPAIVGGILGGVLLVAFFAFSAPSLPAGFLENGREFSPPIYTRLLYGGITEEVLIRYGLMSFFTWVIYRLSQKPGAETGAHCYLLAILLSSILFGVGHLPVASLLSVELTPALITYIIIGNSILGVIAGLLYWRRGLEAAILAHMLAHLVMIAGEWFM
nr:CPBP family glutamic-type intramembrane protease [Shewanella zhuhaiensis]